MANSVDPDQMLHSAASDLGLIVCKCLCVVCVSVLILRVITVKYECELLYEK